MYVKIPSTKCADSFTKMPCSKQKCRKHGVQIEEYSKQTPGLIKGEKSAKSVLQEHTKNPAYPDMGSSKTGACITTPGRFTPALIDKPGNCLTLFRVKVTPARDKSLTVAFCTKQSAA